MTCNHVYHGPSPAAHENGDTARVCRDCGWRERRLVLPYIPPGSNQLHRMHHQAVAKWRRQIGDDVAVLLIEAGPVGELLEHAIITLDFRWKDKRRHDPGNGVEGMKAAVDMLVAGRWIVDDDTEHLALVVRGSTASGEPDHVIITVEAPSLDVVLTCG